VNSQDGILLLALEDPSGLPRVSRAMLAALGVAMRDAAHDAGLSAIVITGTPRNFAAGAEISELAALDPQSAFAFARLGQSLYTAIENFPLPVIAAIEGHCLGGGFDLAMACHLRIAGDASRLGHPGGALGIFTGWGGTQRLPRLVRRALARELLLSGRTLSAEEARAAGLVNRVVPAGGAQNVALSLAHDAARHRAGAGTGEPTLCSGN
jgi:enoyl-CoA hydratase/carnithine racemase